MHVSFESILCFCFCFLCFAKQKKPLTSKYGYHCPFQNTHQHTPSYYVATGLPGADCVPLHLHRWTLGPTTRSWLTKSQRPRSTPCSQLRLLDIENEKRKKCKCARKINLHLGLCLQSSFALLYGLASPPPPKIAPTSSSRDPHQKLKMEDGQDG